MLAVSISHSLSIQTDGKIHRRSPRWGLTIAIFRQPNPQQGELTLHRRHNRPINISPKTYCRSRKGHALRNLPYKLNYEELTKNLAFIPQNVQNR